MATKNFDSLYESLLTELTPVAADEPSFGSSLEKGISSAPGGGYLIGSIATTLGKTREEVVQMISKSLFSKVFGEEGHNPANTEEEYRSAIADALKGVIDELKTQYPDAKIPSSSAIRGYTARVISSLGQATKNFSENVSKGELSVAVAAAAEQEDSEEHADGESVDHDETSENTTDETDVVAGIAQPTPYKAYNEYYIKNREDIPSGTITRELEPIYSRIEGMAGSEASGEDIETRLRKAGTEQGRIVRYIKDLIKVGVIEPAESAKTSDEIEALEGGDEDMDRVEKDTFNKLYGHAFKDYVSSGGAPAGGYGGDYED
jgi:hypothetical protein